MKIAIPIKMNKANSAIAPLFGKAKWFAIVEDGQIIIEPNQAEGGRAVIEWFNTMKIDTIIMQEMGEGPYEMIRQLGTMKVYHSGFERITLDEVLQKFEANELPLLDEQGMAKIIEHQELKHSHDNDHEHGHTH